MRDRVRSLFVVVALAVAVLSSARLQDAQDADPYSFKDHYTKREVMIPMRDGVKLFTILYEPRDTSRPYPILVNRTAYGQPPYGPDRYRRWGGPYVEFSKRGYIFAYQDVRGRGMSEGEFVYQVPFVEGSKAPNSSTDMYDTVAWLLANVENHNGRVAERGVSWTGWEASMGAINAHPALRLSSPQAPPQDQFFGDDLHSNGAFQLAYAFDWMAESGRRREKPTTEQEKPFDYGTPDGYRFFMDLGAAANARKYFGDTSPTWDDLMRHPNYDEYWKPRYVSPHLRAVKHPALVVGGWFDAEDFNGAVLAFHGLEEHSPGNRNLLVLGPWIHGGWASLPGDTLGAISFGSKTGEYFRNEVEVPLFEELMRDGPHVDLPKALVFETGANRWQRCAQWPPVTTARSLYLGPGGTLSFTAAAAASSPSASYDEYRSNPAKPVPYTAEIVAGEGRRFIVEDQRFVASRPDVLVYESEPLTEDLTVAGPVPVRLVASTSGTDSDWVVKLIDVFAPDAKDPDPNPTGTHMGGYQMLLTGDILRGRFHRSFEKPEALVPGRATPFAFDLPDRFHTFKKGHRLMVQVQSTWFPMFDRNPQTFVDVYHAQPADYRAATQRIYRGGGEGSRLLLPVLAAESRCDAAPVAVVPPTASRVAPAAGPVVP
jgi:putative CocE/NonD family hydrolase